MKKLMSYTMIALLAPVAISIAWPGEDALMAKEKAAWQAFKDKKAADFKKVVRGDMRGVYAKGISTIETEMEDMQKWDMKSFAISDFHAISAGENFLMSTYKVTIEGTYDGKDASGTYNAGSVWKKFRGEWQAIFHTNVKEATSAKPAG